MAGTASKSDIELKNVEFESSEDIEVVPTFQAMKLREELLRGIYAYGIVTKNLTFSKCCLHFFMFQVLKSHRQSSKEVFCQLSKDVMSLLKHNQVC